MKKLHIICPYIEGLTTIKSYLDELQSNVIDFKSIEDSLRQADLPDLIILFANKQVDAFNRDVETLKNSTAYARVPRIIILPFNFPGQTEDSDPFCGQVVFQLPVDKLRFLSVVSTFLKRAQRRLFRILITLQAEGANVRYSGLSMDFSETGMAFESASDFAAGDRLIVHFVNPRNRKRFLLKSEIARKAKSPASDTTFYGIRFVDLSDPERKHLRGFITGEE